MIKMVIITIGFSIKVTCGFLASEIMEENFDVNRTNPLYKWRTTYVYSPLEMFTQCLKITVRRNEA